MPWRMFLVLSSYLYLYKIPLELSGYIGWDLVQITVQNSLRVPHYLPDNPNLFWMSPKGLKALGPSYLYLYTASFWLPFSLSTSRPTNDVLCVISIVLCCAMLSCSVMSDSLLPHGLESPPGCSVHGSSPGKNTGVGCHALPQVILVTSH